MSVRSRFRRPSRRTLLLVVPALLVGLVGGGVAVAATAQPSIITKTPKTADSITNIDVLRQQIKNYYGDPLGTGTFTADSNYTKETTKIAASAERYLDQAATKKSGGKVKKAILLDVDDTSLATYNYEVASNWKYVFADNAEYVNGQKFPAVPGMVALTARAAKESYAVFYLTGRGAAQEKATLGNLTADGVGVDAGFASPTTLRNGEDGLFTKPAVADYPAYLQAACAADPNGSCTTVHYKSATRKHIESLGYDIVANFGDQYSDLEGGYSNKTVKLPNPSYYIP